MTAKSDALASGPRRSPNARKVLGDKPVPSTMWVDYPPAYRRYRGDDLCELVYLQNRPDRPHIFKRTFRNRTEYLGRKYGPRF